MVDAVLQQVFSNDSETAAADEDSGNALGLSDTGMLGIYVGAGVAGLILLVLLFVIFRRYRKYG